MKVVPVKLDDSLHEIFKDMAKDNYMSMSKLAEKIICDKITEYRENKGE